MPDLVLWGAGTTRTIRAHWAMQELGLTYRCEPIQSRSGETQTDRFGAVNPMRKIPALVDGDFTIAESAAILAYLSSAYGTPANALVPSETRARARYDEWASFILMELDATSMYVVRRHQGLPGLYGEAPAAVDAAFAYFSRQTDAAARSLDDGRPWLLGDRFSGVDMLMTTCLTWASRLGQTLPAPLASLRDRATARPAYIAAAAANQPSHWA